MLSPQRRISTACATKMTDPGPRSGASLFPRTPHPAFPSPDRDAIRDDLSPSIVGKVARTRRPHWARPFRQGAPPRPATSVDPSLPLVLLAHAPSLFFLHAPLSVQSTPPLRNAGPSLRSLHLAPPRAARRHKGAGRSMRWAERWQMDSDGLIRARSLGDGGRIWAA